MNQADQNNRIDYVEFCATDLEVVKKFYGGVFGWDFQDWGDEYCSFKDGATRGGGAGQKSIAVFEHDFAVGTDIDHQPGLCRIGHPARENPCHDI